MLPAQSAPGSSADAVTNALEPQNRDGAGVDSHTLQALGGWKTGSMVSRYAHTSARGTSLWPSSVSCHARTPLLPTRN